MAQRTIVQLTDDLDGTEIKDGKGETVSFELDGTAYEIDLADKNAKGMRDAFSKYVSAARKAGGGSRGRGRQRSSSTSRTGREGPDPKEVRAWAESQGIEVSQRGRVPANLIAQFQEASK